MARPHATDEQKAMQRVFGENVKVARLRAELTQEKLAHALEVNREYMSDIERGVINISMTRIVEIADKLACPVADLFDGLGPSA